MGPLVCPYNMGEEEEEEEDMPRTSDKRHMVVERSQVGKDNGDAYTVEHGNHVRKEAGLPFVSWIVQLHRLQSFQWKKSER